jgi:hypothetical protein
VNAPSQPLVGQPGFASKARTRVRVSITRAATKRMEEILQPAIDELQSAINVSNGAGVYHDVSRVRSAMAKLKWAIELAQQVDKSITWPTAEDYDHA